MVTVLLVLALIVVVWGAYETVKIGKSQTGQVYQPKKTYVNLLLIYGAFAVVATAVALVYMWY